MNPRSLTGFSLILLMLACSLPGIATDEPLPSPTPVREQVASAIPQTETPTATPLPIVIPATPTVVVRHSLIPATSVDVGDLAVHDAVSVDTAADNRAPYGDLYSGNLFERPFLQDMTYVPDIDIASYRLSYDEKFFYVSIELVGTNPNNEMGIQYGVELDMNRDGFGDYIIVAYPPHSVSWSTNNVHIAEDTNFDTGGLSADRSDAQLPGDGYDTVIFDGGSGEAEDPDLAWARINAGSKAAVQFAFKRSFAGTQFLFGVIADGGIKNIEDLDYVDRFTEGQAGSPEKSEDHYPLKAVYAVDNVCREAFGFTGTKEEPQRCRPK
jgi:hypothetical protein